MFSVAYPTVKFNLCKTRIACNRNERLDWLSFRFFYVIVEIINVLYERMVTIMAMNDRICYVVGAMSLSMNLRP